MAGSGGDLSWLKPLSPDGNLSDDALGCHRGDFEIMNVRNAQPGFTYGYARATRGRVRHFQRKCYKVVSHEDPERMGDAEDPNYAAAGLDSTQDFDDVVLMKCPTERVRERQRERIQRTEASLKGVTAEYLDGAGEVGGNYHSSQRPIRYKAPHHRIEHGKTRAD